LIALATGAGSVLLIGRIVGGELAQVAYVALAVLVYAITVVVYRYLLGYGEAELKGKHRYITTGIGTYIITWMMALVLAYTLFVPH
jgi:hypothetical protein